MALSESQAKICPRCNYEAAEPDAGICRCCKADIERAGEALVVALRDTNARTNRVAGWLQRKDGSWAPVDDWGNVGHAFAFALGFDEHAVITVEPTLIDDAEVD